MKKVLVAMLVSILFLGGCSSADSKTEIKQLTAEDIAKYAETISEDPLDGEFVLNGKKVNSPAKIQYLFDAGLEFTIDKGDEIPSMSISATEFELNNGSKEKENSINIYVLNDSAEPIKLEEGTISSIFIENLKGKQTNTFVFSKGITLASTYDEIIAAYGKPGVDYMKDGKFIKYQNADSAVSGRYLEIQFEDDAKTIKKITLGLEKL